MTQTVRWTGDHHLAEGRHNDENEDRHQLDKEPKATLGRKNGKYQSYVSPKPFVFDNCGSNLDFLFFPVAHNVVVFLLMAFRGHVNLVTFDLVKPWLSKVYEDQLLKGSMVSCQFSKRLKYFARTSCVCITD